jgi:hypothetical protein
MKKQPFFALLPGNITAKRGNAFRKTEDPAAFGPLSVSRRHPSLYSKEYINST